ncbi:MAG: tRNA-dihydrouridine synthase [Candidatus Falkowbacteria bacterium]
MAKNFWLKLKQPIIALAPMAGVGDSAFRQMCAEHGAQVLYSEMASAAALFYKPEETLELLKFDFKKERPYVVQLFGSTPEHFAVAAQIITKKVKPDGIDINFGCPVKKVIKTGAGAALMQDLKKSRAVIEAVINNTNLPVSIKIRAASGKISAEKFLLNISDLKITTLMIHGRTLAQGFSGDIDCNLVKMARQYFSGIILINGGINNYTDIENILAKSGADGVGIARGAYGNPWIFSGEKPAMPVIFKTAIKHAALMFKLKGKAGIIEMRKHLCWYISGFAGAAAIRAELVKVETLAQIKKILK